MEKRKYRVMGLAAVMIAGFTAAAFCGAVASLPKSIAKCVPADFTVAEDRCIVQDSGIISIISVYASKPNKIRSPFSDPETATYELSFMKSTTPGVMGQTWSGLVETAEAEANSSKENHRSFKSKEAIPGGTIYWYNGKTVIEQGGGEGEKKPALELLYWGATVIRQTEGGVLNVKITGYVGDQNAIRKLFK